MGFKESNINRLIQRIQSSKASLSLILTTLTWLDLTGKVLNDSVLN